MESRFIQIFFFASIAALSLVGANFGDPAENVAAIAECTSEEANAKFQRRLKSDAGKIWLDVDPGEHACLEILPIPELHALMASLKSYHGIKKDDQEALKDRIEALSLALAQAQKAFASNPPNLAELNYILERTREKLDHLRRLDEFLKINPEDLTRSKSPDLKSMEGARYQREYIYLLDPGLRDDWLMEPWKIWSRHTKSLTLRDLGKFYLWLEAQAPSRFYMPLAPAEYRDNSIIEVTRSGETFHTQRYGAFNDLQDVNPDEVEEDGSVVFLYLLSADDELYIAQSADLKTHSLLAHGAPVKGAGTLTIKDGKINYIDNASGHYKPNETFLFNTIATIKRVLGEEIFADPLDIKVFSKKMADQIRGSGLVDEEMPKTKEEEPKN